MDRQQVEQLADLAGQIPARIRDRYEDVERWREELTALEGKRCTGRVAWRDKDVEGQTPKMIVLHSVDDVCQVHGDPGPGGRLRVYVGVDEVEQQAAREAILLEQKGKELERRIGRVEGNLRSCQWKLEQFYREVGYRVVDGVLVDAEGM